MVEEFIRALVEVDQRWVPSRPGTSLYIRRRSSRPRRSWACIRRIQVPVLRDPRAGGAYYKEGMNPVRILASDQHVRAVKGGLGAAKTMANYAASLYGAEEAQKAGYTQVLWLDGVEHATSTRSAP